jgi:hypothetical protein
MDSVGPLFILLAVVAVIGITIEVLIRRRDRRHLKPWVKVDGIKIPARADPRTGLVSTDGPLKRGQVVEVSYTEDP